MRLRPEHRPGPHFQRSPRPLAGFMGTMGGQDVEGKKWSGGGNDEGMGRVREKVDFDPHKNSCGHLWTL